MQLVLPNVSLTAMSEGATFLSLGAPAFIGVYTTVFAASRLGAFMHIPSVLTVTSLFQTAVWYASVVANRVSGMEGRLGLGVVHGREASLVACYRADALGVLGSSVTVLVTWPVLVTVLV